MYTVAISSTIPVPNAITAGGADLLAESIVAEQILSDEHIGASRRELQRRMNFRSVGADVDMYITASEIRHHAVIAQHVSRRYAAADSPAWFLPAINAGNEPIRHSVETMETTIKKLAASTQNYRMCSPNSLA